MAVDSGLSLFASTSGDQTFRFSFSFSFSFSEDSGFKTFYIVLSD
jgi:hypothetical protein